MPERAFCGIKRPAFTWGCGGGESPRRSVCGHGLGRCSFLYQGGGGLVRGEWVLDVGEVGAEDGRHWGWNMGEVA